VTRDPAFLAECRALVRELGTRPTLAALRSPPDGPALERRLGALLATIRRHVPAAAPAAPADGSRVRAVHWNIEHGNQYARVEEALRTDARLAGADIVTLCEVDLGMARAGNRDVAADLGAALGLHAVWAPLFLETTPGRHDDAASSGGRENQEALFGIAVLSRWPISDARIVELPSPTQYQFDVEGMYGRFIALAATIERPGAPFVAVAVHLEVHRTRRHRAAQVAALMEALRAGRHPVILGGDFNTHTFDRGRWLDPYRGALVFAAYPGPMLRRRLLWPERGGAREPLFDALGTAGFEWEQFNDRRPTLALRFTRVPEATGMLASPAARAFLRWPERRALLKLDWFAGRGWSAGRGETVTGLDGPGRASDHAPLIAEFW